MDTIYTYINIKEYIYIYYTAFHLIHNIYMESLSLAHHCFICYHNAANRTRLGRPRWLSKLKWQCMHVKPQRFPAGFGRVTLEVKPLLGPLVVVWGIFGDEIRKPSFYRDYFIDHDIKDPWIPKILWNE